MNRIPCWLRLLVCCCLTGAAARAESLWELSPYDVAVRLAVHPGLAHELAEEQLLGSLTGGLESAHEGRWRVHAARVSYAEFGPWIRDATLPEAGEYDKWVAIGVAPAAIGQQVTVREFDRQVMRWGDTVHRRVRQPSQLGSAIASAVHAAFAPIAEIRMAPGGEISLHFRAEALPAERPVVQLGDRFQPILRRNDRQGNLLPDGVTLIPWTHLEIVEDSPGRRQVAVRSGLRSPLARRRRGNIQWFALRIQPRHAATVLQLVDRDDPRRPLVGYEVHQRPVAGGPLQFVGITDRRGELQVAAEGIPAAEWLVSSGRRRLAKLVVIPGQFPRVVAELDNDAQRLRVEGRLRGLQENLIDLVARREVLLVRARAALNDGRLEAADALMDELRRLPGREQLTREIQQLRNTVQQQSNSSRALADKLFAETLQIVTQMLDHRPVRQLEHALTAAKQAGSE